MHSAPIGAFSMPARTLRNALVHPISTWGDANAPPEDSMRARWSQRKFRVGHARQTGENPRGRVHAGSPVGTSPKDRSFGAKVQFGSPGFRPATSRVLLAPPMRSSPNLVQKRWYPALEWRDCSRPIGIQTRIRGPRGTESPEPESGWRSGGLPSRDRSILHHTCCAVHRRTRARRTSLAHVATFTTSSEPSKAELED